MLFSALEYELFIKSLEEITDPSLEDHELETLVIDTYKVKLWLRGRYADIPAETINEVFQLLDPALNPTDTITGAQFFAVLRLVIHVENGSTVNSLLVFEQLDLPPPKKRARIIRDERGASSQFLKRLRNKHKLMPLPSVAELPAFLNTPLEESDKIVISQQLFDDSVSARPSDTCGEDDLSVVFKIGDVGLASVPFTRLLEGINSSRTEDGYHQFWDDNIRKALETLIPEGECIRNSNYDKETYNARPDFGFLITKRCVFRGEEKGPTSAGDPASELIQKLVWAHDSAPYILGYYANETVLTWSRLFIRLDTYGVLIWKQQI
ncbi:hypothetical protein BT96DRAFT_1023651 [Gymnopus androsaceus JB14]|uniref:Uncharacterized protein n=1 Tax=Gymnopus androsaceus JB14 TaxID=1447944 RepID=A0A6A4H3R5_9AGAR|nr:hypothetical protein BT96DRAFT_1023651 [Gymnopus androsaceus JB14]